MKNLLLVVNRVPVEVSLMLRAKALADALSARLYLYHAVYDPIEEINKYVGIDNFSEVRDEMVRERQLLLERQLDEVMDGHNCRVEWCKRCSEGVATWAENISADAILMEANLEHRLGGLVHTPDDWNLLRRASCPVMVLAPREHPMTSVVAAVDCLDTSEQQVQLTARILDNARAMAKVFHVPLNVVSVLPASPMKLAIEARVPDSLNVLSVLEQRSIDQLQTVLDQLGIEAEELQVLEGKPEKILAEEAAKGGLLVIGSSARKGFAGTLLGNTAERILHRVQGDILVVN